MLKKLLSIFFLLLFMHSYAYAKDKLNIVTSITPPAYFIERIGGDLVEITVLIPPGGNPHTYEPTPRQMAVLSRADLYVEVGSGIEFELAWMERLKNLNKAMPVCDLSEGITRINAEEQSIKEDHDHGHSHHGDKDPHIWLSPSNAVIMAQNILKALINIDPSNTAFYIKNTEALVKDLKILNQKISAILKDIIIRKFYIFHPAWVYFARDFNLEQVPVEYSGKEPTPGRMAGLVKNARKENIKVIFSSPQFSRKSADVIAREINGKVLIIDPMSGDYINNLEHIANIFRENMQ